MMRTKTYRACVALSVAALVFLATTLAFATEEKILRAESVQHDQQVGLTQNSVAAAKRTVRCDRGHKLGRALRRVKPGTTIRVRGNCQESVVVATDDLHIIGIGGATIDGGSAPSEAVLLIDGARGFIVEGLAVRNGADQGILVTHQAQGILRNVASTANGTVGLAVDRSHVEIENVSLNGNGSTGLDAFASSTVVAFGDIEASENAGDGLVANGKTFLEVRGASVLAERNPGSGISIINDSRLQIFSFPEAQGSTITARNNGFAGIGLAASELSVVGQQFFGSGANVITASDNGVFGFFMPAGGLFSPHATAKFVATGNSVGVLMEDGARALVVGGLDVRENNAGISAGGAGTLTLVSVPPNPSVVDANLLDFEFTFGTRATIDGVTGIDGRV